jgi:hypothetical protein
LETQGWKIEKKVFGNISSSSGIPPGGAESAHAEQLHG